MAAPTDVRVESNASTQAIIRWTYAGANSIAVYRAIHGGSFSEITTASTRVAVGTTIYVDNTAQTGVFYDYKLSDDVGSTFSSTVSVVIQVCGSSVGSTTSTPSPSLPQFTSSQDVNAQTLQQLSQQVEAALGGLSTNQDFRICPRNGSLVLDCSKGGPNFIVEATEDINSMSIIGCQGDGSITFTVPANTTRKISGWPAHFGFSGDEGFRAPIRTGGSPRQVKQPMTCKCQDLAQGAIGFTPGFNCLCEDNSEGKSDVPPGESPGCNDTNLIITPSRPNNSMDCSGSKALTLTLSGGCSPYSWVASGGVQLDTNVGTVVVVTPPANTGSGVAGVAYWQSYFSCHACSGGVCTSIDGAVTVLRNCDDSSSGCTTTSFCTPPSPSSMLCGGGGSSGCDGITIPCTYDGTCASAQAGNTDSLVGNSCDKRDAGQIAAGCNPCGVSVPGQTVTVTDTNGVQTTVILRA